MTRDDFKEYCLRKLGKPVINIEVTEDQLEDRLVEAIRLYTEWHFDATVKQYYKYLLTEEDIQNQYIILPDNILEVSRVISPPGMVPGSYLFDIRYQIAMNDITNLTSRSLAPYVTSMQHLSLLNQIINGQKLIRFNRHRNRLNIDMRWEHLEAGKHLMIECNQVLDPELYNTMYEDRWLTNYYTALIKTQWGQNLSKFANMPLPGGLTLNVQQLQAEAADEKARLEQELKTSYTLWDQMYIG